MLQFRACYMESGARKQGLSGQVSTSFVIGADGSVLSASEVHDAPSNAELALTDYETARSSPRFPDPNVSRCVARVFRSLRFPKPKSGTLTVVYPLIFKAE
jgi:outer membrane biosynthesis protein TonB